MNPELRAKIIAFNQMQAVWMEKCGDMDVLVSSLLAVPHGQLKRLLAEDALAVLAKYGDEAEN